MINLNVINFNISILFFLLLVYFIIRQYIKSHNRRLYLINYNKALKTLDILLDTIYDTFRRRDLAVYLNSNSMINSDDFIELSKTFIDTFKDYCGNKMYIELCNLFGSEQDLISHIIIKFDNKISTDKMIKLANFNEDIDNTV